MSQSRTLTFWMSSTSETHALKTASTLHLPNINTFLSTNMHHRPRQYYINEKEESKVIFISRLVPYTAQMDLPCYVSDQITRKPALTSAFGISPRTASPASEQNSMHELGFLLWVTSRCIICFAQMYSQKTCDAPFTCFCWKNDLRSVFCSYKDRYDINK